MAKNVQRVQVIMECVECRKNDLPGASRYVSMKNKRNTTERLELKKYCKYDKRHTVHKEIK